ncbi:MAG: tetratricopeptide repeat protein [Bacteroidales bacterium]|nr:tetratricopeptide repeat protein [Bacteroidales bacterium]
MKRILFLLALIATVQVATAQVKPDAARKALQSAEEAAMNAKKNTKAAVWTKYGEALVNAYEAPTGGVQPGWPRNLITERPSLTQPGEVNGQPATKLVFADKNIYVDDAGNVIVVEVTKPIAENALDKAVEAYKKAYEMDPKTEKDVLPALQKIVANYTNDAINDYTFGNYAKASETFEKAANASLVAPLSKLDESALYNAGFTASLAKNYTRAKSLFQKCIDNNYYGEDGDIYAKLADACVNLEDVAGQKKALEDGFAKFPQSQGILVGLINYYLTNNEDPQKLFTLLDQAKKNEPTNASLYYVEGNIHAQLKNYDEAVKAYEKCAEIQPEYEYGYIGEGLMYYNMALEVQTAAQEELDDNKYMALVEEFEKDLKGCIDPFEKAYNMTKDDSIKGSIAEYLKQAYYRFRDADPKYMEAYEKYNAIVEGNK